MTWIAVPVPPEEVTAEMLYELGKEHRLVPENTALAMNNYKSLATSCALIKVKDSRTEDEIATVVISGITDGEEGTVDLIPVSKYFSPIDANGDRNTEPFLEKVAAALAPVFGPLIKGRGLRRLNAEIPKSRSRTYKILRECGFKKEGVKRDGVKFKNREVEDLVIMGMLADKE